MSEFLSSIWFLFGLFLFMVFLVALLSPFEALGNWAGWSESALQRRQVKRQELEVNVTAQDEGLSKNTPKYFFGLFAWHCYCKRQIRMARE